MPLLAVILIAGCVQETPKQTDNESFIAVLEQKNPELCLDFENETIDENTSIRFVNNLRRIDEDILFRDLCLIYTMDMIENINDENIALCNEASERNYTLWEEGSYDIPAWEFCFRKAFNEYKSYPQPPTSGNIIKKETCDKLRDFKDNCLWLVAMNTENESVCELISNVNRKNMCIEAVINIECSIDTDCDDGDPCTEDFCSIYKQCSTIEVDCISNDGCCPSRCSPVQDNDCRY
jgi:hypothetical protein